MNTKIALLTSGSVTVLTLLFCDMWKLVPSPIAGVTHWIPEMIFLFFIGRYVVQKLTKTIVLTIAFCLCLYVLLTYTLLYGISGVGLGLGASSLFSGTFLMGVSSTAHR